MSWLVIWLFIVTIVTGQSTIPDCFQACVLDWCTDITHLNCVCVQQSSAIKACVSQSCNSTDISLSQQFNAQFCAHVTSSSSTHTSTSATPYTAVSSSTSVAVSAVSNSLSASSGTSSLLVTDSGTFTSPTSEPISSSVAPSSGLSASAKGGIIGGVIGGVALLAAMAGLLVFRRHRKRSDAPPLYSNTTVETNLDHKTPEEVPSVAMPIIRYPDDYGEIGGRLNKQDN